MSPLSKASTSKFEYTTEQLLEATILSLGLIPYANKDDSPLGKAKRLCVKRKGSEYICEVRARDEYCSSKAIFELSWLKAEIEIMLKHFQVLQWPLDPDMVHLRKEIGIFTQEVAKLRGMLCEISARRNYKLEQCEEDEALLREAMIRKEAILRHKLLINKIYRIASVPSAAYPKHSGKSHNGCVSESSIAFSNSGGSNYPAATPDLSWCAKTPISNRNVAKSGSRHARDGNVPYLPPILLRHPMATPANVINNSIPAAPWTQTNYNSPPRRTMRLIAFASEFQSKASCGYQMPGAWRNSEKVTFNEHRVYPHWRGGMTWRAAQEFHVGATLLSFVALLIILVMTLNFALEW